MQNNPLKALCAASMLMLGGCDLAAMQNEAANKHEYSILQALEYQYRDLDHRQPYIVLPNVLDTTATVIALPIAGRDHGYVVMLANARGCPKDKRLPEVAFTVTPDTLAALKRATPLTAQIEQALRQRLRIDPDQGALSN